MLPLPLKVKPGVLRFSGASGASTDMENAKNYACSAGYLSP